MREGLMDDVGYHGFDIDEPPCACGKHCRFDKSETDFVCEKDGFCEYEDADEVD